MRADTPFLFASAILFFLASVVPNSLQVPTAVALGISAGLGLVNLNWAKWLKQLLFFWGLSSIVTLIYLVRGMLAGAPQEALEQTLIIYIMSPLAWIIVCSRLAQLLPLATITRGFVILAIASSCTVAIFFALFITGGPSAVSFFRETGANVNLISGYAASTMHVYGSFIFFAGFIFASPMSISPHWLRWAALAAVAAVAITSGRSALLIAVPMGFLVGEVLSKLISTEGNRLAHHRSASRKTGAAAIGIALLIAVFLYLFALGAGLNMQLILYRFWESLTSWGGDERQGQFSALISGIIDTFGLGAGHGIGVDFVRSTTFPWRYELVWVASVLRVGILGAFVYAMVFIDYYRSVGVLLQKHLLTQSDVMFIGALTCALVASATNPYIEAFTFQWMYIAPVVILISQKEWRLNSGWMPS